MEKFMLVCKFKQGAEMSGVDAVIANGDLVGSRLL